MMQSRAPILPECVCGSLRQASRALTQRYDEGFRPLGLKAMQFQILMTLRSMERATIAELTGMLTMDQTTLTRSMALLVRNGWVVVGPRPDRRLRSFELTDTGIALLGRAMPVWEGLQSLILEKLDQAGWMATRDQLRQIISVAGG